MWEFETWNQYGKDVQDLSFQINDEGAIPLECPADATLTRKCKTKLYDVVSIETKEGMCMRVLCKLCGWNGIRIMGEM